ncbi:MAG: HAD-IA family hydrolase [Ignavibacteriaceae bacterium]|jgi:phosphoglycolate phosphatase-like HAD superfamily hydrolase
MKIDLVVFDLDGTLVSSHETIYKATLHALKEINISAVMPEDKFYNMIGLHFEDIFREFGFAVPDFEKFLNVYKSIYFNYIDSSVVYSGVEEAISKLKEKRIKVSLLTTKGQDQAELILRHFSLFDKFDYVMGRRPGLAHKPSPEPLQKICADLKTNILNTLIVGDSEMDIQCGKNAGSKTCAVTYGYRTKSELQKSSPDFLIDKILDVEYIVNGK